jgi:hypothetical protein
MAKMSVAEAAQVYEDAKRRIDHEKSRLEASSEVLKEYFRKRPSKRDYRGRIGFAVGTRRILDNDKVKAELGDKLDSFKKTIKTETLSLLKP